MNDISYVIIACYPDRGMKYRGSKSLMEFNGSKLLQHQIDLIISAQKYLKNKYEIILVCDFDKLKIHKAFGNQIKIVSTEDKTNPVFKGCSEAKYDYLIFMDYGCMCNTKLLKSIQKVGPSVVCTKDLGLSHLDVGCITSERGLEHMFLGLDHKFTNMFILSSTEKQAILQNNRCHRHNLLYFEILNILIENNCIISTINAPNNSFYYFNHMRQKNGISKFIKKNAH